MSRGPLSSYRVLDLAGEAGAYGTKLLAGLGADVIKIEPPEGDAARRLPPFHPNAPEPEASLWFTYMNTGKRSITLDLHQQESHDLFHRLTRSADVVFDTSPSGFLDDLGIGPRATRDERPELSWVAVTPFGLTGPHRHWKGSDLIAWAASGVLFSTGDPDRPPLGPAGPALLAYVLASLNAAVGALLALRARRQTGRGQLVDISVQEAAAAVSGEIGLPVFLDDLLPRIRSGNRRAWSRPWGLYPCKDGWISLVVAPNHWPSMAKWINEEVGIDGVLDPALNDFRMRAQITEALDEWTEALTTRYTKREMFAAAQKRGLPVAPVNTIADIAEDEHLQARNYWVDVVHPRLGELSMAGPPFQMSDSPWRTARAPMLGEDNGAIYSKELNLSQGEISALRAARVI